MSQVDLPIPPMLTGTERNQINQLRDYLFRMSRTLNDGMRSLDLDNFAANSVVSQNVLMSQEQSKALEKRAQALRALIISTATEITSITEEKFMQLNDVYMAKSDYGTLFEEAEGKYTFSTQGLNETLTKTSTITNLNTQGQEFQTALYGDPDDPDDHGAIGKVQDLELYQYKEQASIFLGWVTLSDGTKSVGLALGHDFEFGAVVPIDDVDYQELVTRRSTGAVYSAEGIEFYLGGNVVASFRESGDGDGYVLDTSRLIVDGGSIDMSPWRIDTTDGFKILYVG